MRALLNVILLALQLYTYLIIASAILSWLVAFNVINTRNDFVRSIWNFLDAVTQPVLRPIRNILPNLGGVDISPIILIGDAGSRVVWNGSYRMRGNTAMRLPPDWVTEGHTSSAAKIAQARLSRNL
jgi:YggT family protein